MNATSLELPKQVYADVWKHLLPRRQRDEEAAFCFVRSKNGINATFEVMEWRRILPEEFDYQSPYHLELRDDVRAEVIKRAHDLGASIAEFHSHVFGGPPEFSGSDIDGFEETVPHCIWRLKGKPYFAVVVSKGGFDGLAWFSREGAPTQLGWIRAGRDVLTASGRSLRKL